jgi:hypothetical protein
LKALALDHNAFAIDHESVLFQTLFGLVELSSWNISNNDSFSDGASDDVVIEKNHAFNLVTKRSSCVILGSAGSERASVRLAVEAGLVPLEKAGELVQEFTSPERKNVSFSIE